MSLKFLDILREWNDPADYPDPSGESFVDPEYNDVDIEFSLVKYDSNTGLFITQHIETKKYYLSHTDGVDGDLYQADTYSYSDYDEDGAYTYDEIDKDNAEMTVDSLLMHATIAHQEDDIGIDFDEWESGRGICLVDNILLRGLYLNDRETFDNVNQMLKDYNREKRK